MGLEVVTYISDLNANWPVGTDKIREGDDHIRNVKTALLNTFPNIAGAVTLSHTDLNLLPAWLDEFLAHVVPVGIIAAWSGSEGSIPTGWALCNGSNGTPDLRGKFIIGAGGDYDVADTGGAESVTSTAKSITISVDDHILTTSEIPAHQHLMFIDATGSGSMSATNYVYKSSDSGGDTEYSLDGAASPAATVGLTANAGGGAGHNHDLTQSDHDHDVDILPPYYALCWIMKTLAFTEPG